MASIKCLGTHVPSGLGYLIAESILPPNPTPDLYTWTLYDQSAEGLGEEEILTTDHCVVWSVAGVVRKVFRLESESQSVTQALLTWFFFDDHAIDEQRHVETNTHDRSVRRSSNGRTTSKDPTSWSERSKRTDSLHEPPSGPSWHRALVAVLKQQAHIFLLNGSSHVINLPFEVEKAFSAPHGVVFQRRIPTARPTPPTPLPPNAPPSSLFSSQVYPRHSPRPRNTSGGSVIGRVSNGRNPTLELSDFTVETSPQVVGDFPRLFTLTDPLAEVGLVADSASIRSLAQSPARNSPGSLGEDDEIVYISPRTETKSDDASESPPLVLLVTVNRASQTYKIWYATYAKSTGTVIGREGGDGHFPILKRTRRSSFGPLSGTGASTPAVRAADQVRESFGNSFQKPTRLSESFNLDREPDAEDVLNFEGDHQLTGRIHSRNRRVSSLVARAELAGHEQSTFTDLARNQGPWNSGPGSSAFRGQSFDRHAERTSFGRTRLSGRVSTSATFSRLNDVDEMTQQDFAEDELIEELLDSIDLADSPGHIDLLDGLRTELVVTKICTLPMQSREGRINPHAGLPTDVSKISAEVSRQFTLGADKLLQNVCLYFVDRSSKTMSEVDIQVQLVKPKSLTKSTEKTVSKTWLPSKVVDVRSRTQISDAMSIASRETDAMLLLPDGQPIIELQSRATWVRARLHSHHDAASQETGDFQSLRLQIPESATENDALSASKPNSQPSYSDAHPRFLAHPGPRGCFDIVDRHGQHQRFQMTLRPRSPYVFQALELCRLFLCCPGGSFEDPLSLWWQVCNTNASPASEWRGLVICVFVISLRLIGYSDTLQTEQLANVQAEPTRRHPPPTDNGLQTNDDCIKQLTGQSCWSWTEKIHELNTGSRFISDCILHAKNFVKAHDLGSPSDKQITGQEGTYALARIVVALHLFREEQRLDITSQEVCSPEGGLKPVLRRLGKWLGWDSWSNEEQVHDSGDSDLEVVSHTLGSNRAIAPFAPPSIFAWFENAFKRNTFVDFPSLNMVNTNSSVFESYSGKNTQGAAAKTGLSTKHFTPRTDALVGLLKDLHEARPSSSSVVEKMVARHIDVTMLESLPEGIVVMLRSHITEAQSQKLENWSSAALKLVSREDLDLLISDPSPSMDADASREQTKSSLGNTKDVRTICESAIRPDVSSNDNATSGLVDLRRLVFRDDERSQEADRLLRPLAEAIAEIHPRANSTEAEFLEEQKVLAQMVYKRTMAIPSGKAVQDFAFLLPLPSQKIYMGTFNTSCRMQPSNVVVNADKSNFTEEKVCWAFFHAGVSSGLSVVRNAVSIDTSWLVLNKPQELGNRHAGLLLALGLNGNLKSMAKWLAFKYLTPKHNMTSIGLLLGLSASRIGTMDSLITRLLSVHVVRLLPPGAAELNLSPLTQTAALMGIGLLYYMSQHRRMSEVMLSEIEHAGFEDPSGYSQSFRNESYRLAAGFALGLINLGQGANLHALRDLHVVERLLKISTGSRDIPLVHIYDQATAGATIAIALIFMKTNDGSVSSRIDIPSAVQQFEYVRPDVLLLRVMAKNIIMWDSIEPTDEWVVSNLPKEYREVAGAKSLRSLENIMGRHSLSTHHLPFFNILAGQCWALSLKFAGTGSLEARNTLLRFYDYVTSLLSCLCNLYDQSLTRDALLRVQHLLALSAATVMAGSGDLYVLRRLRILHATVRHDSTFGHHQAAHVAIGCLFMGRGRFTFKTSNFAVASLICAFYPIFPKDVLDNKAHLQAFRHFWTFAAEPRCLVPRDIETNRPVITPVVVTLRDGSQLELSVPCLLPDLDSIARISTTSPEYWQVVLDFEREAAHLAAFRAHQTIYLRRKSLLSQYHVNPFAVALASRTEQNRPAQIFNYIFDLPVFKSVGVGGAEARSIFPRGQGAEYRDERALPVYYKGNNQADLNADAPPPISTLLDMRTTHIDDLLVLGNSVDCDDRDRLVGLRVIFAWAQQERQTGRFALWLPNEAVDALKAAVIKRIRSQRAKPALRHDDAMDVDD